MFLPLPARPASPHCYRVSMPRIIPRPLSRRRGGKEGGVVGPVRRGGPATAARLADGFGIRIPPTLLSAWSPADSTSKKKVVKSNPIRSKNGGGGTRPEVAPPRLSGGAAGGGIKGVSWRLRQGEGDGDKLCPSWRDARQDKEGPGPHPSRCCLRAPRLLAFRKTAPKWAPHPQAFSIADAADPVSDRFMPLKIASLNTGKWGKLIRAPYHGVSVDRVAPTYVERERWREWRSSPPPGGRNGRWNCR